MLRLTMSVEKYNELAKELKLKPVLNQDVKTVNYTYVPNYSSLDYHQKSLILAACSERPVYDKQGMENLIAFHKDILSDLEKIKEKGMPV